jgi:hypothetical protein
MRGSKMQMKRVCVDYDPASGAGERESCEKADAQTGIGTQALVEKSFTTRGRGTVARNESQAAPAVSVMHQ